MTAWCIYIHHLWRESKWGRVETVVPLPLREMIHDLTAEEYCQIEEAGAIVPKLAERRDDK